MKLRIEVTNLFDTYQKKNSKNYHFYLRIIRLHFNTSSKLSARLRVRMVGLKHEPYQKGPLDGLNCVNLWVKWVELLKSRFMSTHFDYSYKVDMD